MPFIPMTSMTLIMFVDVSSGASIIFKQMIIQLREQPQTVAVM